MESINQDWPLKEDEIWEAGAGAEVFFTGLSLPVCPAHQCPFIPKQGCDLLQNWNQLQA